MSDPILLALFVAWAAICICLAAAREGRLLFFGTPLLFMGLGALTSLSSPPPTSGSEARLMMVGWFVVALVFVATYLACAPIWIVSKFLSRKAASNRVNS